MAASSIIAAIADEVAEAINGQSWAESFTACRTFRTVKRKEDLEGKMLIEVLPRGQKRKRLNRGYWQVWPTVVVGITAPIDEQNSERQADHYNGVADDIANFLQHRTFTLGYLDELEEAPTYHPQRLDLDGVFTRAIVLTFGGRAAYGN